MLHDQQMHTKSVWLTRQMLKSQWWILQQGLLHAVRNLFSFREVCEALFNFGALSLLKKKILKT